MENYIRQIILASMILLFFSLESIFPHFKNRPFSLQVIHSLKNIFLGMLSSLLAILLFSYITGFIMDVCKTNQIGILHLLPLPAPAIYITGYILLDFWMYIWHTLNHRFRFLWKFHQVHHTDIYMNASSAIRFHPIEILLSAAIKLPVFILTGMTPEVLIIYEICLNISTIFHHSNWGLPEHLDRIVRFVLVTPNMHRMHHSVIIKESDSNYSTTFSLWDRLLGTYTAPAAPSEIKLGVRGRLDNKWQRFDILLLTPFLKSLPGSTKQQ